MAKDFDFFNTIKQRVDLEEYLEKYCDVELVPDGPGRSRACCPFHEEDTPSFKVQEGQKGYKTWRCYGACGTFGSVIDAVMLKEGIEAWDAAQYLNEEFELGLEANNEAYQRAQVTIAENKQRINTARENFEAGESREAKAAQAYLARRGYSKETIEHFKLGIDTTLTKTGRISIPLIDKANHEVSVDGRALYDGANCRSCGEWVTARTVSKRRHKFEVMTEKGTAARKKLEEAIAKHGASSVEAKAAQEQVDKYPLPDEDWRACPHCHACGDKGVEAGISWLTSQDPKYRFVRDFDKSQFLYHEYETRKALVEDAKMYRQTNDRQLYGLFLVEGYADCWAGWQAGQWAICSYNGQSLSEWQAAEIVELAEQFGIPVILVPDYDTTGFRNVENNIAMLRKFKDDLEIQVLFGVDKLTYKNDKGEEKTCKDLGDVLQYIGVDAVAQVLLDGRRPAEEWQIRRILEATLKNGYPAFSKQEQMNRIAGILSHVKHRQALDHLIDVLAAAWGIRSVEARGWFYSNLSSDTAVSHGHLVKNIEQAQAEARDFHLHAKLIPMGFEWIDKAVGGGVRRGWLSMLLGKSGTGKTMLATQILANMAQHGTRSIFFSLEQKAGQLFERIASQVLEYPMSEIKQMIIDDDPQLATVRELYKNLYIVDNVPTETTESVEMSPARIEAIVREVNMTHFQGAPADVVVIDHLGILKVPEDAPRAIKSDPLQAAGYIMEEMFHVCKSVDVFMVVLQQLPKEIKSGVEFEFDAGRGGSAQTDFCDLIFCVWRPEQEAGLEEADKMGRSGQYKLKLAKNRYGSDVIEHLYFDKSCLRIIASDKVIMPLTDISDEPRVDVPGSQDGEVITIDAGDLAPAATDPAGATATATAPASEPELFGEDEVGNTFVAPEPTNDTKTVAESLGLAGDEDDDDDSFISWLDN